MHLRVEAVLSEAIVVDFGCIAEGVVGPVHEGVLAEGSHSCGGGVFGLLSRQSKEIKSFHSLVYDVFVGFGKKGWVLGESVAARTGRWNYRVKSLVSLPACGVRSAEATGVAAESL